jgi:cellulose synthase operon protein YhjQ
MESKANEQFEDQPASETPEDVAILYSWANLHGAKYRDFSASRREYRAQLRHRAAEHMRELELKAQAEAEAAAALAETAAREAKQAAHQHLAQRNASSHEESLRTAEDAVRKAAAERTEAARRADAAAAAEAAAQREEREIAEAHASAQRQAARYNEAEIRRRELAGPQPVPPAPGQITDPYGQAAVPEPVVPRSREEPRRPMEEVRSRIQVGRSEEPSGYRPAYRPAPAPVQSFPPNPTSQDASAAGQATAPTPEIPRNPAESPAGPAWLYAPQSAPPSPPAQRPRTGLMAPIPTVVDTLQQSRERVASRWYALKGVFDQPSDPQEAQAARQKEIRIPLLAVYSLAGGVGKTSLVATLGRTLSSQGERVTLNDTTSHGLLPFYFGASDLRPGVVRTFSPPSGHTDAPISLVSYDLEEVGTDAAKQDQLVDDFVQNTRGANRILLDLSGSSSWIIRRLAAMNPTVLIPVAPDMNSVISLQAVEKLFHSLVDSDGRAIQPFYLLNQFDTTLPLHLDVREVLRRQLGDRLLPFVIRRAPAVSEALAEGMTVVDYAPDAPVTEDYAHVANWLRKLSAPVSSGFRNVRWSER